MLTAPFTESEQGHLRGLWLLLTELTPYVLWLFVYSLVTDGFSPKGLPNWLKAGAAVYFGWLVYFFAVELGKGVFHQVNNWITIILVLHVVYLVLKDWRDDLDNSRRKLRALLISYVGFYAVVLAALESIDSDWKEMPILSMVNVSFILLSITVIGSVLIHGIAVTNRAEQPGKELADESEGIVEQDANSAAVPIVFQHAYLALIQLMESGFYTQTSLTISELATELKLPEHQLRELINKHLGYRNFSTFLNSYRLPAAKAQLADATKGRIPILTIALELGYGSIGPFNRAFKAMYQQTPSEYRQKHLQ